MSANQFEKTTMERILFALYNIPLNLPGPDSLLSSSFDLFVYSFVFFTCLKGPPPTRLIYFFTQKVVSKIANARSPLALNLYFRKARKSWLIDLSDPTMARGHNNLEI